jgi:hypothetical protein
MTRTQLLEVATQIVEHSVDSYRDAGDRGTIYTGLYRKRPMNVFVSRSQFIVCVAYNKVAYFVEGTDRRTSHRLRTFCCDHDCQTRVFLYPESKRLLSDDEGDIDDPVDKRISKHFDYNDLIPIPYKA